MLRPSGEPTGGEAAARQLGVEVLGGRELSLDSDGSLALPGDVKVIWWHCEAGPLPGGMQSAKVKQALLDWLEAGHGLFLSGTALSYVQPLGLEAAGVRLGQAGNDDFVAGLHPGAAAEHPVYAGFERGAPIRLTSAGYPAFSDFHGSGGPSGGVLIGNAHPDAGERPFVEYAYGNGRIIALGWRLPYYGLPDNAHRGNLERLTGNILRYLSKGEWFGQIEDSRTRVALAQLGQFNVEAMRRAIEDLTAAFPDRYSRGEEYLASLDRLPGVLAEVERNDPSATAEAKQVLAHLNQALLDNPLLDFERLLLIKRNPGRLGLPQNWQSNSDLPKTGYDSEIAVLSPVSPDGELTTIFRPEGGEFVGDVDLHFDGTRMLFSMPSEKGPWRIFEMNADGSDLRQLPLVEEPDVDNYDACYLPDDNIIFTSTAPFVGVPCVTGSSHVANLYHFDRDTGDIRRLTFEQDHDWCPTVLNNGRVLYLRWEYSDIPHFVSRILFHMDPDGTQQMEYYGSNSYWPNAVFYARPIPRHPTKFVGVVGGHHDRPRMGELVLFDAAQGKHEADGVIQRIPGYGKRVEPIILDGLTASSWPKFLHPYPLSDKYFLVACRPTAGSNWGIYLADVFDNLTLIKELDGCALLEPVPLRSTPRPPVIPPKVDPQRDDALVYLVDIYDGNGLAGVPRGTVKTLRLFTYHFCYHGMGGQVNRVGIDGPWDIKRIMGTVPVEPDGSALFRVPANTPLSVQPLDEKGQALQLMRSWMTAMPGEVLSCVGCHEPQRAGPVAATPTAAVRREASEITPWYGPTRGFSFDREVQPVLDRYCVTCHDGSPEGDGKAGPDLSRRPMVHPEGPDNGYRRGSRFSPSYLALRRFVRAHTIESDIHLLMPGEFCADTTHLVQMLRKGHEGVELDDEAWKRLTTWIDLSAPAHGTWHEIVGHQKVDHMRDRRRAMDKRYAGRDEDPEAIIQVSYPAGAPSVSPSPPANNPGEPPACPGWPFDADEASRRQAAGGEWQRTIDLGDGVTLELVRVPAGEFVMGDVNGCADESPQAAVRIDRPFWIATSEITNQQFGLFDPAHDSRLEGGDYLQFSIEERGYPVNDPSQPVCRVSWDRATAFCRWLSDKTGERFTLPTEAQWEYACRSGTDTPLWYGAADSDFAPFANLADARLKHIDTFAPWSLPSGAIYPWRPAVDSVDDGHRVSAPVGSFAPNPWGLRDMHGNVAEWTRSPLQPYPYGEDSSGDAESGGDKVVRGGSWYELPERARSAFRLAYPAYRGDYDDGFRVISEAQ